MLKHTVTVENVALKFDGGSFSFIYRIFSNLIRTSSADFLNEKKVSSRF